MCKLIKYNLCTLFYLRSVLRYLERMKKRQDFWLIRRRRKATYYESKDI